MSSYEQPPRMENEITAHLTGSVTDLRITYMGSPDQFGFYSHYVIEAPTFSLAIPFQKGAVGPLGPTGVTIEALLAVCQHRLAAFQSGPLACAENKTALEGITTALEALNGRVRRRMDEGKYNTEQV